MPKVSIIIPVTRKADFEKCLSSLKGQSFQDFEIIVICDKEPGKGRNIHFILEKTGNPALRRNLGAKKAKADILAFIDDDAVACEDWVKKAVGFLDRKKDFCIVGGPDIIAKKAGFKERVSEVLLSHKYMGSGVLAHRKYPNFKEISQPSSLSLCNLFVRKKAFEMAGGFNEKIGYGGEDTEFMHQLKRKVRCRIMYHPHLVVYHKKRDFMLPYLKQRLKFRINNGKMIYAYPELYFKNYKFIGFFIVGTAFFVMLFTKPFIALFAVLLYNILTLIFSIPYILKDSRFIILPFAFGAQHFIYYVGILLGLLNIVNYSKIRKIRRN